MDDKEFVRYVTDKLSSLEGHASNDGDRFALWFLIDILGFDLEDALEYHVGGPGDNKLDIAIKADSERSDVVILGQTKYTDRPNVKVFDADVPAELADGENRLALLPDEGLEARRKFAQYYNGAAGQQATKLRIVAGFGRFSDTAKKYALSKGFELYDFDRLKSRVELRSIHLQGEAVPMSMNLTVESGQIIEFPTSDTMDNAKQTGRMSPPRQWFFLSNVTEIRDALHKHKDALFADNLRYKLSKSARSGIGKEIRDTIIETPEELSVYNNGLTIVARSVSRRPESTKPAGEPKKDIITLVEPQIVNGCQTSWAIYDALESAANHQRTIDAYVFTKLIEVSDNASLVKKITKYANRQNAISARDLRANDELQIRIASAFKELTKPVFYEYKEGTWESTKGLRERRVYSIGGSAAQYRRLLSVQAAQTYLALIGLPHWAKQFKGRIFGDDYYSPIFNVDLSPARRFAPLKAEENVKLVGRPSGITYFRDDTLFAFAIVQLADVIKNLYIKKMKGYAERETFTEDEKRSRDILGQDFTFLGFWQYLLIALIQYVIDLWVGEGRSETDLRVALIGADSDAWFASLSERRKRFNASVKLSDRLVLADENPSSDFPLFCIWLTSLADKVAAHAKKARANDVKFDTQAFIDQRALTITELKSEILDLKVSGQKAWSTAFPLPATCAE